MQPHRVVAATRTSSETVYRSPSPDFSSMSIDELDRLEQVLRKQVEIENEQKEILAGLRRTMVHLQETIEIEQNRSRKLSSTSNSSSPIQQVPLILSSSDIVQCYVCFSTIEIKSNSSNVTSAILCHDCHRPICRHCGNFTSPEFSQQLHGSNVENQSRTSKWRCRMCIVRREVVRKSGSWNMIEDETPTHSPVRLLEKIAAYRASTISSFMNPSPSPESNRKLSIFAESTNFFSRLWRSTSQQSPKPTQSLATSHKLHSTSFDQIPESSPTPRSASPTTDQNDSLTNQKKDNTVSQQDKSKSLSKSMTNRFRAMSTVTEPSFDDTTSEIPFDTASEIFSQSFETNFDSSNPGIVEEQEEDSKNVDKFFNYDKKHRRMSYASKNLRSLTLTQSSTSSHSIERNQNDDVENSPETSIDLSMVMDYSSNAMLIEGSASNENESAIIEDTSESIDMPDAEPILHRRSSRSGVRNSYSWVRRRALMQRGGEWMTTLDRENMSSNRNQPSELPVTNDKVSFPYELMEQNDQERSGSIVTPASMSSKSDSSTSMQPNLLRRRRSSRRLPAIPVDQFVHCDSSINVGTRHIDDLFKDLSKDYPSQPLRENSLGTRSNRSKSIDSDASAKSRSIGTKLLQAHQAQTAKSIDVSNLARRKSFLTVNDTLIPQRSLDYPYIVRKTQDLSDIVRRRMLYSKISKQQQGDSYSISLERDHIPKVPRKIIIRQDNSIEIALSKPPKLRRQTLSEEYYHGCSPDTDFGLSSGSAGSSTLGLPLSTSMTGSINNDRRKTIETCENIYLHAEESSKLRARTPPANPHRVLLHRDKADTSIRTNGLGMRIIGGQECEDGSLGCFVTSVTPGGPANIQGNIEVGDQILEFNGNSLIDSTYEEVRMLQDQCGDIVQLVVQHNNIRLQINGGQNLSSIEISRHFETVPRLASSITRKRRNLPPLPPSQSTSFNKQLKRPLYQTVETLEVPNVKELKPILINRGRLLAQIWHDIEEMQLALTIIQASNLPLRPNGDQPYAYIAGKMLFEDRGFDIFETKVIHSSNPIFNETFVFHDVDSVDVLRLEISLLDRKQTNHNNGSNDEIDEFIGIIQLPLSEANLEDEPRWYELRDRQARKSSTSNVTFHSSSTERSDHLRSTVPMLRLQPDVQIIDPPPESSSNIMIRAPNEKPSSPKLTSPTSRKHSTVQVLKNSPNHKNRQRASIADPSGILTVRSQSQNHSYHIEDDDDLHDEPQNNARRQSALITQSAKLSRRISQGLLKLIDLNHRRFSESTPKLPKSPTKRKLSAQARSNTDSEDDPEVPITMTIDSSSVSNTKSPRQSVVSTGNQDEFQQTSMRSIPLSQMPIGQLMLPYISSSRHSSVSGSRKSSAASYCDSDDDIDRYFNFSDQQQDSNEEPRQHGTVQTHQVGPGQVAPRNYENTINDRIHMGEIQLGLIVTKGLLEIDVICCRGLQRIVNEMNNGTNSEEIPPDTYVKTYLRTGTRRVQKRKTLTVKASFNPEYHSKLKYNACNVMGRRLQVTVWQRAGKFEKNQCIGEAFIQLDNLTLTQLTMAWYKLFREKLVESEFYDSS